MKYLITGASGTLGQLVVEEALTKVDPADLILVTRSPAKLEAFAERGAEVRKGDFDDPESLRTAFAGADRMLLISTDAVGNRVAGHRNAIDAARAAGVGFIAYTSVVNPVEESPVAVNPDHRETERLLAESGIAYTALRNALYTDMEIPAAQGAIATGRYVTNRGEGRVASVSRADCARIAAAALVADRDLETHYDVTGPAALTAEESAAIYAEVGGTPVETVLVDDETFIAGLVETGIPEEMARVIASFGQGIREGYSGDTSDAVERLTGRAPESVKEVLKRVSSPT